MRRILPLVLAAIACTPIAAQETPVHHLAHVTVRDTAALQTLLALDLDLASCSHAGGALDTRFPRTLDVIATDADLQRIRAAGFRSVIAIPRLEEHYARQAAAAGPYSDGPTPPLGQGAMGGHWTLAQMEALLDRMHANFPGLCTAKVSIGQTIEQRDVWMVKISDNVGTDENEPEVMFDAMHHAREPLAMETTIVFMEWLLNNYGSDPDATFLVDERELFFVPLVNPDGYEYNRQQNPGGGGLWRKNRRNNGGGSFGVDVNRNYPTGWSAPFGGNSTNPNSETYRGTAPASEPEVQAIINFAATRSFTQAFSVHTYTDVLLGPWGYQGSAPPNPADYDHLGNLLTASNGIGYGSAFQILYPAAGTTLDHYVAANNAYSWTPELGRADEGGFWPSGQSILDIANRHQPMFRTMALTSGPWLQLGELTVREAAGGNGNGRVDPGETGELVVRVDNLGVLPTTGTVPVSLTVTSAGVSVGTGSITLPTAPMIGSTTSNTNVLTFALPANYASPFVDVRLSVSGDGATRDFDRRLLLAGLRLAIADDMEQDRGFARDTSTSARTGNWERAAPQQTTSGGVVIQPGQQATPGGQLCWITDGRAGASAGTYDVDGGPTDLVSPVLDLAHLDYAEVVLQRWYGESTADDPFQIDLSLDGGRNWTNIVRDSNPTGAWIEERIALPMPLSAETRLRFRCEDANPSLLEAGVDDFELHVAGPDGSLTLLGSGTLGTTVQLGVLGSSGGNAYVFVSDSASGSLTLPGVPGVFELGFANLVSLPPIPIGATGAERIDIPIPPVPALAGGRLFCQTVHVAAGGSARIGNVQSVTLR